MNGMFCVLVALAVFGVADAQECEPECEFGTCVEGAGINYCECNPGFFGVDCSDALHCNPPCIGANGHCEGVGDNYDHCVCNPGFAGYICETNIDECNLYQPCEHDGICEDGVNAYTCLCQPGFAGTNCTDEVSPPEIDECLSQPCKNGGECVDGDNGYTCHCTQGFSGTDCNEPVASYIVKVYTRNVIYGGTNANVYVTFHSGSASSSKIMLVNPEIADPFERGKVNWFYHTFTEIGQITDLTINHNNKGLHAEWALNKVVLINRYTGEQCTFFCGCWLGKNRGDKKISRTLQTSCPILPGDLPPLDLPTS